MRTGYLVQAREREKVVHAIHGGAKRGGGTREVWRWAPWRTVTREGSDYDAWLALDAARRRNGLREYRVTHRGHPVPRPQTERLPLRAPEAK